MGRFINADSFASTSQGFIGNNMFAYCLNAPVRCVDLNGYWAVDATEEEYVGEENPFQLVGAGIQLSGSTSYGPVSGGGGLEIIVYWDTAECKAVGNPIVAIYAYGETDMSIDTAGIDEIAELLLESADILKLDGVNTLEAIMSGYSLEFSATISPFAVTANSRFYGVEDYTGGFQNMSVNIGSITSATAWSDCCQTYSVGYTYTFGKPKFWLKPPSFSRGSSYYGLLWTSA